MTTQTQTLTDFILARIAEDEVAGTAILAAGAAPHFLVSTYPHAEDWPSPNLDKPFDPARVLADCEAKRRIVELHRGGAWPHPADPCDAHDASGRTIPCDTLRLLALPYTDHPGHREEWRP